MKKPENRDGFVIQAFAQYKQGLITLDDIAETDWITEAEKIWLLGRIEEWRTAQLVSGEYTLDLKNIIDPIDSESPVLTWGTANCDKKFSPIEPEQLVIVAGRQGSGKTAWTMFFAEANAAQHRVLYISLEMSPQQILTRAGIAAAKITPFEWQDKTRISEVKRRKYHARKAELRRAGNLLFYGREETAGGTVKGICDAILRVRPALVIVDNLDLVAKTAAGMSDYDHHNDATGKFLGFTSDEQIPIVLLHHLKKSASGSDVDSVRGSGKITDNADVVMMVQRYAQEVKPDAAVSLSPADIYRTKILQGKDRTFGNNWASTEIYFDRGKFCDDFEGTRDNFFEMLDN